MDSFLNNISRQAYLYSQSKYTVHSIQMGIFKRKHLNFNNTLYCSGSLLKFLVVSGNSQSCPL